MRKRRNIRILKLDSEQLVYDTAFSGPWTLAACQFSEPEKQTNIVQIPGRDGVIDLMAGLTDGEPRYNARTLTVRLECSERNRAYRTELIDELVNLLDGFTFRIILPDDPLRYIRGTIATAVEYNDVNHCAVTITATCDPWRVSLGSVTYDLPASAVEQSVILRNNGRRRVTPSIAAYAASPAALSITISCGHFSAVIEDNRVREYDELRMGYHDTLILAYKGSGTLHITWREAIL